MGRKAFVAFQGGGAKGISHVGALSAVERADIEVLGVAGTSAGAIVAALVAAGYTSREIFAGNTTKNHLLTDIDSTWVSATKLFGSKGWRRLLRVRLCQKLIDDKDWIATLAKKPPTRILAGITFLLSAMVAFYLGGIALTGKVALALMVAGLIFFFSRVLVRRFDKRKWISKLSPYLMGGAILWLYTRCEWEGRIYGLVSLFVVLLLLLLAFLIFRRLAIGLTTTNDVKDVINKAIIKKLQSRSGAVSTTDIDTWSSQGGINFKQFEDAGGLPLRIVATDIVGKTVQLFSAEETPELRVADAVCASLGLPCVFKVQGIHFPESATQGKPMTRYFLDGGLLSNLPLWVFDEDRALNTGALTIGFVLNPTKVQEEDGDHFRRIQRFGWVPRVLDAIISGPGKIHQRAIDGLLIVSIPTSLGLLSFDESYDTYKAEIEAAEIAAYEILRIQVELPSLLRKNIKEFRARLLARIRAEEEQAPDRFSGLRSSVGRSWDLGVALAIQRPGYPRTLWVDINDAPPWRERSAKSRAFPLETSLAGLSWKKAGAVATRFGSGPSLEAEPFPGSTWAIAAPVPRSDGTFDIASPAVVLMVDSQYRSRLADSEFNEKVSELAELIEEELKAFALDFYREMNSLGGEDQSFAEFVDQVRRAQIWQ